VEARESRPLHVAMFYHSVRSDWNNGNAHFLRGIATELQARGHEVTICEPADGWSVSHLRADHGEAPLHEFHAFYPTLRCLPYVPEDLDVEVVLREADLVLVHEWNEPDLVERLGAHRASWPRYRLLFHDTHHRSLTDAEAIGRLDLTHYDGVLAFGNVIRDRYLKEGWARRAWTWHEAADVRVFTPRRGRKREGDLVWIGNWGDEERTRELHEFLVAPVRALGLKVRVYGVRYPRELQVALGEAGIEYAGWLPNYRVPETFGHFGCTVHIPRGPYAASLPGIPTIRVFEALACGIPLACSPWEDAEGLFTPGKDFLSARDGEEMARHLRVLLEDEVAARELAEHGRRTVLARHTCAHRVDELLAIYRELVTETSDVRV